MKGLKTILAVVVMVMTFAFGANAQTNKKASKEAEVKYSVFLHCESCKKKIEAVLPYVKGVKDMKVDMDGQTIWIKYDNTKTNKGTLAQELKKLGYEGKEVDVAAKPAAK